MNNKALILQCTLGGAPVRWINFEIAARYYTLDLVGWSPTEDNFTIYGGTNRRSCNRSFMNMSTIVAIKGEMGNKHLHRPPVLTNRGLFKRDQHVCAYCGNLYNSDKLTRDHIHPKSRGGKDTWMNVVCACSSCNRIKDDRTPEEAGMKLLFVPYVPVREEILLLSNRNVLVDQMEYLKARIPQHSRVHNPFIIQ